MTDTTSKIRITLIGSSPAKTDPWKKNLHKALATHFDAEIFEHNEAVSEDLYLGELVFVDAQLPELNTVLSQLDRKGRAFFLITEDPNTVPTQLISGHVDDVLVFPFRALEVHSKIAHYHNILMWDEVKNLNESFQQMIELNQQIDYQNLITQLIVAFYITN